MTQAKSDLASIATASRIAVAISVVAALYLASDVLIPLALGILLSFLLSPVVNRLERRGMPNWAAVLVTAALTFLLLAGGVVVVGRELSRLAGELPRHKEELITKARNLAGLTTGVGGSLDELAGEVAQAMEEETNKEPPPPPTLLQRWTNDIFPAKDEDAQDKVVHDGRSSKTPLFVQPVEKEQPLAAWATTAGTFLGPLTTAGLVTVFALFILIHREDLRDRIIAVVSHGNYVTTTEALDEAARRISRYLMAQTTINVSYGFVLSVGLMLIGGLMTPEGRFPNAILWGVLATCLRFVPYVGPIMAAVFPLAIAVSVFSGYGVVTAVLAWIVVMELLSNNVFEPWLYGASTGISAVAVILAAVFWGWLWGPVGLLLSTPLTVCLVVIGRYVPGFHLFTMLLGEEVAIKSSLRFYHRLLAGDYDRAKDMLRQQVEESDWDTACDRVVVPTLRRIRADVDAEHLSELEANRLLALVGGVIEGQAQEVQSPAEADASEQTDQTDPETTEVPLPLVMGCMSHHLSESLVLNMLRTGGQEIFRLQSFDDEMLAEEVAQQVAQHAPSAVVVVVMPPGGFAQARYLCQAIRSAGYRGVVIACCLGRFKHFDRLFVKFRRAGATVMTTSYSQTRKKLESIVGQGPPVKHPQGATGPQTTQATAG